MVEPDLGSQPLGVYKDGDQSVDLFREKKNCSYVDSFGVYHLFEHESWVCNLLKKNSTIDDTTCATVDTGCQRLAIGIKTLEKFQEKMPQNLKITLQKEFNRFRSVHQTSVTTKVASIPFSLGRKGTFLKPAVFETPGSEQAPFLLSLSFLLHCKGTLRLNPDEGLQLMVQGCKEPITLHLGPTGALRIPLQNYNEYQMNNLGRLQESPEVHNNREFEVLNCVMATQLQTERQLSSPIVKDFDQSHGVRAQQEDPGNSTSGVSAHGQE